MEDKRLERKRFIVSLVVYGVCLSMLIGFFVIHYTVARYSVGDETSYSAELKDFNIDFQLKYTDGGIQQTVGAADLSANNGVVRLTKEQYNTLELDSVYSGEGRCYYRVKIIESWIMVDGANSTIIPHSLSEYDLNSNFYDNRSYDGWIYCKEAIDGESDSSLKSLNVLSVSSGGIDAPDLLNDDASNYVEIAVEVEAVQWNRAKEIWGLNKLPWE